MGSAIVTTEPSMNAIAEAKIVAASTNGRAGTSQGASAPCRRNAACCWETRVGGGAYLRPAAHARESASTVKLMVRSLPSSYSNTTGDGHQRPRRAAVRTALRLLKGVGLLGPPRKRPAVRTLGSLAGSRRCLSRRKPRLCCLSRPRPSRPACWGAPAACSGADPAGEVAAAVEPVAVPIAATIAVEVIGP